MELSKEQYGILEHFYKETKIYIDDLSKFGIDKSSTALTYLLNEYYLKRSDVKSYRSQGLFSPYPTSYTITEEGKRAYEDYLVYIAQQKYEQQTLELQSRQTVSSEEAVLVAKEANSISRKSKTISWISLGASILSVLSSIASVVISIIALINK